MKKIKCKIEQNNRAWKENNKEYLKELQIFLDKVDAVKDQNLKNSITSQMLICDNVLTRLAEDMFIYYYKKGYKKCKTRIKSENMKHNK